MLIVNAVRHGAITAGNTERGVERDALAATVGQPLSKKGMTVCRS